MEHTNQYQCLDSIRQRLKYLETEVLKRDKANRELTMLAEASQETIDILEARLANLQVDYAYVQAEVDKAKDKIKLQEYWQEQRLKEANKPKPAGVHTTRLYWDCECPKDYINHSYITKCEICGAHKADQPDSRLEELGMARLSGINELAERYARSNK